MYADLAPGQLRTSTALPARGFHSEGGIMIKKLNPIYWMNAFDRWMERMDYQGTHWAPGTA